MTRSPASASVPAAVSERPLPLEQRMPEPPFPRPVPALAGLRAYRPGRPPAGIDLFLDANEAVAAAPELAAALAAAARAPIHRYPTAAALEARLAARHDVDPAQVLVTAGADDALERAVRAVCGSGSRAVLTTPSFEMLGRYVRLTGAELVEVPWWSGAFPLDEAVAAAGGSATLVAVVSPNNPTGAAISAADLARLADRLPASLVLLDHAYVEFADEDLTGLALERPNVLVFRTFSKAWGGAGLRVGYVLGDARVVAWLRALGQPYAVAAPSLAAVAGLLDADHRPPAARLARVRAERTELSALLARHGAEVLPSQANFVLVRPPDPARLHGGLAALGIAVRAFAGRPDLAGWLRIALPGDETAFARLASAVGAVLAPEALLLDMDGVLADVSGSYRAAIAATAASFGVTVDTAEIGRAKARGDATNDWRLTRDLLAARGVEADLGEVTARFEALYQGTSDAPGLRVRERPTVPREVLARLARRRPLAIVTGRPRRDAERFLAEAGIADLFAAVVTMEDAPSKPDPAPVRLALERLGVRRAWMVGDTPDDLAAARGAGVLPLGVVAPGDDPATASGTLRAAGAWRVLADLTELEELLP